MDQARLHHRQSVEVLRDLFTGAEIDFRRRAAGQLLRFENLGRLTVLRRMHDREVTARCHGVAELRDPADRVGVVWAISCTLPTVGMPDPMSRNWVMPAPIRKRTQRRSILRVARIVSPTCGDNAEI